MTVSHEMFLAVRRGAESLKTHRAETAAFVTDRFTPAGFRGRARDGDLYYTVFGLEAMLALGGSLPTEPLKAYLESFGSGGSLDLVHAACLARCWTRLGDADCSRSAREALAERIASLAAPGGENATAYGCFLTTMALQDLGCPLPDPQAIGDCLTALIAPDGGFANHRAWPRSTVPSTAAALVTLTHLGAPVPEQATAWLAQQQCPGGGFTVAASVPQADLLSTAVALHALDVIGWNVHDHGPCRDFVLSLRCPRGGFIACAADTTADVEYTWYALLALGHLAG